MGIHYAWRVLLDDDDWDKDVSMACFPDDEIPAKHRSQKSLWLSTLILTGIIILGAGFYLWRHAQAGLAQIESELSETVAVEEILLNRDKAAQIPSTAITHFDLLDEQALVQLRCVSATQPLAYRETRFYRQAGTDWLHTVPNEAFWGGEESLESEYFVFVFRHRDREAVSATVPLLDDHYEKMLLALGLPLPVDEKIQVTVVPEPGVHARWIMEQTAIELLSPVLIAVPEAVTEAEVLAEGAMHLLSAEAVQVATDIGYGDDAYTPVYLNQGVQLWLSWERDDPLAKYRKVIVPWVYGELPLGPSQLPASFFEMCQLIDIWQRPRWELGVYLPCALTTPVISPDPPPATLLDDIPILGPSHMSARPREAIRGQSLAVATVLAYVAQDFGPARIPSLLTAIGDGDTWAEIAADQFGMCEVAFEAGWHAYLLDEYGVDLDRAPRS